MSWSRRKFIRNTAGALVVGQGFSLAEGGAPKTLKAAVVGHTGRGDYGHGLDGIFAGRRGVELIAVCDPDPAGRRKTAQKTGVLREFADYREMLREARPDLVSIAMRHADQHFAIARAALESGAHVYCEKPFTTTPAEADELLAIAGKRRLKIAVAHTMRMMPAVLRLKQALDRGLIGEIVEMRSFGKQDQRAGGEDMMVLGSHLFDLMRLFAGDPLWCSARVTVQGRNITVKDGRLTRDNVGLVAGDQIFAQFAFSKSVQGSLTSSAALRETVGHWGIEFAGSKSAARINCDIAPNVFVRSSTGWKPDGRTDTWAPLDASLSKEAPEHNLGPVGDWLEAIARDREPECSGRNGAWAVEMVAGVYRAALTGSRISFPLREREHPLMLAGSK